jgi:hypothetical protein
MQNKIELGKSKGINGNVFVTIPLGRGIVARQIESAYSEPLDGGGPADSWLKVRIASGQSIRIIVPYGGQ